MMLEGFSFAIQRIGDLDVVGTRPSDPHTFLSSPPLPPAHFHPRPQLLCMKERLMEALHNARSTRPWRQL